MKNGLVVITYNSESYFKTLYDSIPFHKLDEVVVVNGGNLYAGRYDNVHWIQHTENKYPAQCRNEGIEYLYNKGIDGLYCVEDDMVFKSENIFDEYESASNITGLEYFCFASYAWDSGPIGTRTPRLKVQYNEDLIINFYQNCCNEFTYRSRKMWETVGKYDQGFRYIFDVDSIVRMCNTEMCSPFWYFPDLGNADDLIMNNPDSISRMDSDGNRINKLGPDYEYFIKKYGCHVSQIPDVSREQVIEKLKRIKPN